MFTPEDPGWVEREMQPIMAVLAHKWVLTVLASLVDGPRRRRDLRRFLPGHLGQGPDGDTAPAGTSLRRDGRWSEGSPKMARGPWIFGC